MKQAIVTGANGFIGRHLVKELSEQGYKIWAVVRGDNVDNIISFNGVNVIKCDLENINRLNDMIDLEVEDKCIFYHLAWGGNSGKQRGDYALQLLNAKWAVDAAIVAKKLGCSRIVVSGSVTQLMYRDYLRKDCCSPEIVTCYSVGKMSAEAMLKCVCQDIGLDLCWTYIANFYGEDDTTKNFINFLINNYMENIVPELTPAEQLADFTHVSDVARALRSVGELGNRDTSYYVGFGKPRPLKEFIEIIHDKIAPHIESGIGRKPFAGESIDYDQIDYMKLSRDTGFSPLISFEKGIEKVIISKKRGKKYV